MSDVTKIYNYVPINDQIASSGQPSPEQFSAIKKAGYDVVINLAWPVPKVRLVMKTR